MWIGSVSKTFTATAVFQLAAGRRLELTDTVSDWLPEAGRGSRAITIAELLAHRSGLPDYLQLPEIQAQLQARPRTVIPIARLIRAATAGPLEFEPGSRSLLYCALVRRR